MELTLVLLLGGVVALGVPAVSRHSERRQWHVWLHTGLLPLMVGLAVAPLIEIEVRDRMRPLLVLVTASAGVLAGSQLRLSFLRTAGRAFLRRHTGSALIVFLVAMVPSLVALLLLTDLDWLVSIAWAGTTGALAVASSQRPPVGSRGFEVAHRDTVLGHVAPSGWWNLVALVGGGAALGLTLGRPPLWSDLEAGWVVAAKLVITPTLGLVMGWLAVRADTRDEAYLFTIAVLSVIGGATVVLGSNPLFAGILSGAVFANVTHGRAAMIERALQSLEQPVAMATGLLAGLCAVRIDAMPMAWAIAGWMVLVRWILRGRFAPSSASLAPRIERRTTPAGATGVLLIGAAVSMGERAMPLVVPLTLAIVSHTVVHMLWERREFAR